MKMLLNLFSALAVLSFSITADADVLPCPSSTQFVNIGASVDEVIAKCGQPQQQITLKPARANTVVIWQYSIPEILARLNASAFALIFANGRVMQIQANHRYLPYLACPNGGISLGATVPMVEAACGEPYLIRRKPPTPGEQYIDQPEIIKLIYKPRRYLPKTIFIFEDGHLTNQYEYVGTQRIS